MQSEHFLSSVPFDFEGCLLFRMGLHPLDTSSRQAYISYRNQSGNWSLFSQPTASVRTKKSVLIIGSCSLLLLPIGYHLPSTWKITEPLDFYLAVFDVILIWRQRNRWYFDRDVLFKIKSLFLSTLFSWESREYNPTLNQFLGMICIVGV